MDVRLFQPMTVRDITWKNRVMVSPMWQYSGVDGFPTDWHLMNLGRFADGGAGLVFQEGTSVERRGRGGIGDLGIWDDAYIAPLKRIVDFVRANGAVPAIQLMHSGRRGKKKTPLEGWTPLEQSAAIADWDSWELIAPSAIPDYLADTPREMTTAEVKGIVQAFADAARRAHMVGYDVVEIHGAHGYLIHQFLSAASNQRGDQYGGSLENRMRFACEVVEAVRSEWPDGKPVFMRLSCVDEAGWGMEDTFTLVRRLMDLGVDLIDCSSGGLAIEREFAGQIRNYGYQVPYAAALKKETGVLTAAVGLIVHAEQAEAILASGAADMVAIGREMIFNPNWALDAAHKLGAGPASQITQPRTGFWLDRRAGTVPDFIPSTYGRTPEGLA